MKKLFLFSIALCSIVVLFSCAQKGFMGIKGKEVKGTTAGKSEYRSLEKLYNDKKYTEYLKSSSGFAKKYPDSRYTPEIIYKRGGTLLGLQKYDDASEELYKITRSYYDTSYYNSAIYYYAISEYKKGNSSQALSILDKADFGRSDLDAETKIKMLVLKGNMLSEHSENAKAYEAYADAYSISTDESVKSTLKVSLLAEIDKMKTDELEDMDRKYSSQDFNSYVLFNMGERYIQKGNIVKAKDKFSKFTSLYPHHEYSVQVDNYMSRLKSNDQVDPYTVGVILPLTGKNSAFGQKSLMGIQLAAGIFGDSKNTKPPVKLAIMDSQSDPEVARMSVEKLLQDDHVMAIVGPLGNDEAGTTASQCSMSGVPNITLSQRDNLDGLGQYVFRVAMSNRNQIRRLVSYAMDKLSMTRFGIIYPEDRYGQELTRYFWEEVLRKGGSITAVETYPTGQTDFREQVKKMLGVYYVGTRIKEYNDIKQKMEEAAAENETKRKSSKANEVNLPPINGFDAIFIPDDARVAAQIAPYLPYYDAKNVILLGPNTWNSPILVGKGQNHVNGAIFVDGFTSLTAIQESREFVKTFKDNFNAAPGVLEAQAYDALNIIISAMNKVGVDKGSRSISRDDFRNYITNIGSFTGATGKMKIETNGDIDKQLFVLGVEKTKIILKD